LAHFLLASSMNVGAAEFAASDLFSLQATHSQEELDNTIFASTFKGRMGGLQDYQLAVGAFDDLADNALDELVFALWGTTPVVLWRYLQSATESATNPEYGATMMLTNDQVGGSVGEKAKRQMTFMIASGVLARDIT
jgi:hypothetical protein